MAKPRVRSHHYIGGIGDGSANKGGQRHRDSPGDAAAAAGHVAYHQIRRNNNIRRRPGLAGADERLAAQEHPTFLSADREWGMYFEESPSGDGTGGNELNQRRSVASPSGLMAGSGDVRGVSNGWMFPALAVFLSVVLLSALFLHLISDANKSNQRSGNNSNAYFDHRNYSSPSSPRKTRKKKTDEWNEDEYAILDESDLGGLSVSQSLSADEPVVGVPSKPSFYSAGQPGGLQQHRHRKMSAASSTQPSAFQQKNYYLNPAGGAVIAPYKNPAPSSSRTPTNLSRPVADLAASQSFRTDQPPPMPIPPPVILQQRTSMNPQILSNASSFESTTTDEPTHGANGPALSPHQSPSFAVAVTPSRQSKLWLSPGTDDVTPPAKTPLRIRMSDVVEGTPRAANLRPTYTNLVFPAEDLMPPAFHSALTDASKLPQRQQKAQEASTRPSYATISGSSDAFRFASPPSPKTPKPPEAVPFLPRLDVHVAPEPQPRSMNLDDLHLYQMMESGNVSHWEARVAEESRQLQNQVFPRTPKGKEELQAGKTIGGDSEHSTSDPNSEIPSNDVRKSIHHKRSDLTISTDAASSLQGAIEFSELRLVEVIGGGGFGQVWKAVWRGTPVAVKVLTGSAQSKNVPKPVLEEFVAEINLLKGMRHPNICLYMGACLDPPNRAIITELAANGSLWDALRLPLMPPFVACDGLARDSWPATLYLPDSRHGTPPSLPSVSPAMMHTSSSSLGNVSSSNRMSYPIPPRGTWPWELVKRVACGAARGMAYLHSGKPPVLHRDLKSANILLDESYTAKVCDFGLSRLKSQGKSMTANVGTVQWMAPEVLANLGYNEKADVYSFGIICWELLTRQCPFDGMTAIQCALAVLNRNQRPDIPKWCPPSLHALIRACINKNPDERPTFVQIIQAFDSMP